MAAAVFPDNTVLCNFAAVRRIDLLRDWLRGRGRWTAAVAYEVLRSTAHLPDLGRVTAVGWLGDPVDLDEDRAVTRVEHLRRDVFGGRAAEPTKHLGEAQTCYLLMEVSQWRGSWWVSDDRDALEFARRQGILTRETIDIVTALVAEGDLTAQAGFDLMTQMQAEDRALRMPARVADLTR